MASYKYVRTQRRRPCEPSRQTQCHGRSRGKAIGPCRRCVLNLEHLPASLGRVLVSVARHISDCGPAHKNVTLSCSPSKHTARFVCGRTCDHRSLRLLCGFMTGSSATDPAKVHVGLYLASHLLRTVPQFACQRGTQLGWHCTVARVDDEHALSVIGILPVPACFGFLGGGVFLPNVKI